jgi:hypothetical protein
MPSLLPREERRERRLHFGRLQPLAEEVGLEIDALGKFFRFAPDQP